MAGISSFEEIEAWQVGRQLVREVYKASNQRPFSNDFALRDQIRRAGISIISNIAEGFERGGAVEFARFLAYAKGSAGEARAQPYVAMDQGYIDEILFRRLNDRADRVIRMIGSLIAYLRTPTPTHNPSTRKREHPSDRAL